MRELHPDRECTLTELRDKLKERGIETDLGNLSRYITDLEKWGLIEAREVERRGRPRRCIRLKMEIAQIISSFMGAVRPEKPRRPIKFDKRHADELLSALDASKIKSKELRRRMATLFEHYCAIPEYGLCEHEGILIVFKRMVEEPGKFTAEVEEVADRFYGALNNALRWMLERKEAYAEVQKAWQGILKNVDFTEYVYSKALDHAKDKNLDENLRLRFLDLLETIYVRRADRQKEILNLALSLCSDKDVKPESSIYSKARGIVGRVRDSPDEEFKWGIYERLREKANSENEDERKKFEPIFVDFFEKLMETRYEEAEE